MNTSIAPSRARPGTLVLLAAAVATAFASPATATILDSFTDPLPSNPLLPASGQKILFLGPVCDGASCSPASTVSNLLGYDFVEQAGLPGVPAGFRYSSVESYLNDAPFNQDEAILRVDPGAGGRLIFTRKTTAVGFVSEWGSMAHPMNLDLTADGGDRFEIEVLSAEPGASILIGALRLDASGNGEAYSNVGLLVPGPMVLSVPFASFTAFSSLPTFADDVDVIRMEFFFGLDPTIEFVLGEVRTAGTPVPVQSNSWGRVKSAYRR